MPDNILNINDLKDSEIFDKILVTDDFYVERIVSPPMPGGDEKWYNQDTNELVILLQGNAKIEFENETVSLKKGDYLTIEAHRKHRVAFTGSNPVAIWLAIHYKNRL
jgi:cupin 2 domain-containing protein